MILRELIKEFPIKRIKPVDGLVITADVWDEAHDYHRQNMRFHALFGHGAGIMAGLDVVASDPPDTSVYILPGVAVDSVGNIIILPKPVFYDFGHEFDGTIYLLLSYGEGRPQADKEQPQNYDSSVLYIPSYFSVVAQPNLPHTPYVELARIKRGNRQDKLADAQDPESPKMNELDLRFRNEVGPVKREMVSMGVCYLGSDKDTRYGRGAYFLGRALNHEGKYRVAVDDDVPFDSTLGAYTLVYLTGKGRFDLNQRQRGSLQNYMRLGGTVLFDSADSEAVGACADFLKAIDLKLKIPAPEHRLLTNPYLFAAPPPGAAAPGVSKLLMTEGVIVSSYGYGILWQGETSGGTAPREDIRSALEWGNNIVTYAVERREAANF